MLIVIFAGADLIRRRGSGAARRRRAPGRSWQERLAHPHEDRAGDPPSLRSGEVAGLDPLVDDLPGREVPAASASAPSRRRRRPSRSRPARTGRRSPPPACGAGSGPSRSPGRRASGTGASGSRRRGEVTEASSVEPGKGADQFAQAPGDLERSAPLGGVVDSVAEDGRGQPTGREVGHAEGLGPGPGTPRGTGRGGPTRSGIPRGWENLLDVSTNSITVSRGPGDLRHPDRADPAPENRPRSSAKPSRTDSIVSKGRARPEDCSPRSLGRLGFQKNPVRMSGLSKEPLNIMKRNALAWAAIVISTAALVSSRGVTGPSPPPSRSRPKARSRPGPWATPSTPSPSSSSRRSSRSASSGRPGSATSGSRQRRPRRPPPEPRPEGARGDAQASSSAPTAGSRRSSSAAIAEGTGSGFVYDDKGHIVTNNHVVEGAEKIVVQFYDGEEIEAKVVGTDPKADVAVIKVDSTAYRPLPKGKSGNAQGRRVGPGHRLAVRLRADGDLGDHLGPRPE